MVAWFVKEVQSWVIRDVNSWLVWVSKPTTQGNCDDELGSKGQVKGLRPDMPVLRGRLFMLPDQVARERSQLQEYRIMMDTSAISGTWNKYQQL